MCPSPGKDRILPSGSRVAEDTTFDWRLHYEMLSRSVKKADLLDFYQSPPPPGNTRIGDVGLLALDLETTGMNPNDHAIVSIGYVPFTVQGIRLDQAGHLLVKPEMPLSAESAVIHGITHTELSNAPGFPVQFKSLLEAMTNKIVVVHYHPMERFFLAHTVDRFFADPFEFPLIDTMKLEADLTATNKKPSVYQRWLQKLVGNRFNPANPVSLRLDACRNRYGLPRYAPHHALTDAVATAELFMAQVQQHFRFNTPVSRFWL